jgi:hypothetical protein
MMIRRASLAAAMAIGLGLVPCRISAQPAPTKAGYPVAPRSLGDAEEMALALSAAPQEISSNADVYVLRGTEYVKARAGTNGCACMVGRDLHEGSRYPICFDQEGTRTSLFRELKEGSLRAKGMPEEGVKRAVDAAYVSGELRMPAGLSMAYMMSPRQVLFSSPLADGVRVGAWSPHVMLMTANVKAAQLGLSRESKVDVVSINDERGGHAEIVVKVPKWSDGTPVASARP